MSAAAARLSGPAPAAAATTPSSRPRRGADEGGGSPFAQLLGAGSGAGSAAAEPGRTPPSRARASGTEAASAPSATESNAGAAERAAAQTRATPAAGADTDPASAAADGTADSDAATLLFASDGGPLPAAGTPPAAESALPPWLRALREGAAPPAGPSRLARDAAGSAPSALTSDEPIAAPISAAADPAAGLEAGATAPAPGADSRDPASLGFGFGFGFGLGVGIVPAATPEPPSTLTSGGSADTATDAGTAAVAPTALLADLQASARAGGTVPGPAAARPVAAAAATPAFEGLAPEAAVEAALAAEIRLPAGPDAGLSDAGTRPTLGVELTPPLAAAVAGIAPTEAASPAPSRPADAAAPAPPPGLATLTDAFGEPLALDGHDAALRLGERLRWLAEAGVQEARLQLHPRELGSVDIRIRLDGGAASVWFGAEHPGARAALEANLPALRERFAADGLTLAQADVGGRSDGRAGAEGGFGRPDAQTGTGADVRDRSRSPEAGADGLAGGVATREHGARSQAGTRLLDRYA